jgi:hypothetical protein
MRRMLLYLTGIVLISSLTFASSDPDWDKHHHKHHYATPEPGVVTMLCLSLGTIAGGLALRHRRAD